MNRQRSAESLRINVNANNSSSRMANDPSRVPAWNREQLIRQFQGIDGSNRSEAELQIDAFERNFLDIFRDSLRKRAAPGDSTE